jgi:hypothetical protein
VLRAGVLTSTFQEDRERAMKRIRNLNQEAQALLARGKFIQARSARVSASVLDVLWSEG